MKKERKCSLIEAIGVILVICFIFFYGSGLMGNAKVTMGMSMLLCSTLLGIYSMIALHISWDELWGSVMATYSKAMGSVIILLEVGFLSASWLASGATPTMIYWGMKLLHPSIFLATAFIICSICSVLNGSSWGTLCTFGLAFIGIAKALGVNYPLAIGAIVCGSFIGDKWSPMSDSTNLAAGLTGTSVFDLFIHMFPTNGIAVLLSAICFLVLGITGEADMSSVAVIGTQLQTNFNLNLLTLLPVILVVVLSMLKKPIIPTLLLSSFLAMIMGMIFQGETFPAMMGYMWNGYSPDFGDPNFNELVSGGGLMNTASAMMVMFSAFVLAGIINRSGVMVAIAEALGKIAKSRPVLIIVSLFVSTFGTFMGGTSYTGMVMTTSMFDDMYEESGLTKLDLARTACSGGLISFLVPWGGSHLTVLNNTGLNGVEYMHYAFTLWFVYLMIIVFGFLPTGMFKKKKAKV